MLQTSSSDLKARLFLQPLLKRVHGEAHAEWKNLYLSDFEMNQIRLFDLMANKMPLVSSAGLIANTLLVNAIKDQEKATVLDVGIGSGQQMVRLIHQLANESSAIKSLRIVGIEPAAASLADAERNVKEVGASREIDVEFMGFNRCSEDLDNQDWRAIRAAAEFLVINEAFALHHVRSSASSSDLKHETLVRLKALNPKLFVLSEPNSDHHTGDYAQRFENCWNHFGLVFDVVDRIDAKDEEKQALKLHFFAREIEDILGTDDELRSERHETVDMWLTRLRLAGFIPTQPRPLPDLKLDSWIQIFDHDDYVGLGIHDQPIVAIMVVR